MQIDQTRLNQIEADLVNKVEARIRQRVFRYYLSIGAIIAASLGYFGYDVISSLRGLAEIKAESSVAGAVADAQNAARLATLAATQAEIRLNVLDAYLERREAVILNSESTAAKNRLRVGAISEEVDQELAGIKNNLDAVQKEIEMSGVELIAQFQALRDRSGELVGQGNLDNLAVALETLTLQVQSLGQQIVAIESWAAQGSSSEQTELSLSVTGLDMGAVESILESARSEQPNEASSATALLPTVYFQFAGVKREVAEEISRMLQRDGYQMPGEERIGAAARKREIRYFHESDKGPAERLAEDLNNVLDALRFESGVQVNDYTQFKRKKPRLGTIELWLEPVPK